MKSGPTLAAPTTMPLCRNAAISPVATVVLPTPDDVPATTSRGPRRATVKGRCRALHGRQAVLGQDRAAALQCSDTARAEERVGQLECLDIGISSSAGMG